MSEKYELVLLDYNFLSSPKKLDEYQKKYFEDDLVPLNIQNLFEINIDNKEIFLDRLIKYITLLSLKLILIKKRKNVKIIKK